MSAYVRNLTDGNGKHVYPNTVAKAVYMEGQKTTVQELLDDISDKSSDITFHLDGTIEKTLASGRVSYTTPQDDGSIVEETKDAEGNLLRTKTTSFTEDGVHIVVEESEE